MTLPLAPLSLPAMTTTVSPFLIFTVYSTSGARLMIFMNRLSRSSRPTGPKMRVPRGSPPSLMMTAAFSSKRMYEPSGRRLSLDVRTTTALTTSPFFTPAPGMASLTVATMTSPMLAYRRPEPPSTRMHRISRAPVLSATRSRDSCWITGVSYVCQFFECDRSLAERWWAGPAEAGPAHSLGLFEDLHDPPPLGGGERTGLHQEHAVTDPACVLLVV